MTEPLMVELDKVIRWISAVVGFISIYSMVAMWLSGLVIIHPLFALLLLFESIMFFRMTLVPRKPKA